MLSRVKQLFIIWKSFLYVFFKFEIKVEFPIRFAFKLNRKLISEKFIYFCCCCFFFVILRTSYKKINYFFSPHFDLFTQSQQVDWLKVVTVTAMQNLFMAHLQHQQIRLPVQQFVHFHCRYVHRELMRPPFFCIFLTTFC